MVQVEVAEGILEGEILDNEFGKPYYSFKGIPYAEPPVGELRFKAPKPAKPWKGVRQAKEYGQASLQKDPFSDGPPTGSEDCLYLNVYTPNIEPTKPLPVMFWIHGGGFSWGNSTDEEYGPEFLVRKEVVLVTFNYRLGLLGYLSLDTKDVPGNAGMKDQVQALRWVNKNISKFGGDPKNITIFGESAGGASVSFFLISPMTKGLFKRAIIQSGSITCPWSISQFPRETAEAYARQLGFYSDDDKELYEFFNNQPLEKLLSPSVNVTQARKVYGRLPMVIVNEKDFGDNERFFYGDAYDCLKRGLFHEGVEVLTGCTEHEGTIGLGFNDCKDDFKLISFANEYVEFFVPYRIALECPLSKQMEVGKKIKKFYFKDGKVSIQKVRELLDFISLDFFIFDTLTQGKFISKKNKTYIYRFTCKSERNQIINLFAPTLRELLKDIEIVSHADDFAYLFPGKNLNQKINKDSDTFRLIDNVTTLWTNFAKYGDPTPDNSLGIKWAPYNMDTQHYLDIGNKLVPGSCPEKHHMDLWESIFKEYLPQYSVYSN